MPNEDLGRLKIEKAERSFGGGRRRKGPVVLVLLAVLAAAALYMSGALSPKVEVEPATVSLVYPSQTFTTLNASGYVVAQRKAAVAAKVTGRLEWLGVQEGSRVTKGQVIARLEGEDLKATREQARANIASARWSLSQAEQNVTNSKASLEQAQAELKDAKLNIDRQKALVDKGMVARADYDTAVARYSKAVAAVEGANSQVRASEAARKAAGSAVQAADAAYNVAAINVGYTDIRAPFDAVVLTKNADVGDIVSPISGAINAKAAVVTIADMGSLEVEADVSESSLAQVKAGQPCEVQLDALPDKRFKGEVSTIVPTADRSKASVMVKVRFLENDERILPEMSAKVAFLTHAPGPDEMAPRVAVNPAAVVERSGRKVAFVITGDSVKETPVTPGPKLGDWLEVTGLKPGEKVAISGLAKLKDGTRIKEVQK
jgi:RND family efflux transporter MFP subunit